MYNITSISDGRLAVTKKCTVTNEVYSVTVGQANYMEFISGALAQDAFPELTPPEREFVISGMTPKEWDEMFGKN